MHDDPRPSGVFPLQEQHSPVLALLNPKSGTCRIEEVRSELSTQFSEVAIRFQEIDQDTDLDAILGEAVASGCSLVVAGGGDGTVSAIAGRLVGTGVRLAVLPLGTANVLSLELNIPADLEAACRLAASPCTERNSETRTSTVRAIDAMRVGDRHYLTQVGVGIDALMIQNTSPEAKRRLGKLAYMISATKHILAFRSHRFRVTVDGRSRNLRASQIVIANTGMMGQPSFRWGPDIAPDDGKLNACFIKSAGIGDYARLFWVVFRGHREKTPNLRHEVIAKSIMIEPRRPLPVQADGEIIGDTPVTVEVVPRAVQIIVPATTPH